MPVSPSMMVPGASTHVEADDPTPSRVGRYEPVALMRADEAARVYVARATGEAGFERRVTLAVFEPGIARNEELVRAFVVDARRAARVQHPNVIEVLDIGGTADACFVATEYVEGGDLAVLLAHLRTLDRRVPVDIALAIARRMCDGLAAAHAATDEAGAPLGLLHGALAPSHVSISRTGTVKVGDFGLARATRSSLSLPSLAPELADRSEPADVRADVFGVGAVLYELLAGDAPGRELAPLAQRRDDVPPELEAIVLRALARDRRARQRDCAALEVELAAVARHRELDAGDKQIAQWLATDVVQTMSPTLRGWQAAADPRLAQLLAPRPAPQHQRPSARLGAFAANVSSEDQRGSPAAPPSNRQQPEAPGGSLLRSMRGSGLRVSSNDHQPTVNARPTARASTPPAPRASTPPGGSMQPTTISPAPPADTSSMQPTTISPALAGAASMQPTTISPALASIEPAAPEAPESGEHTSVADWGAGSAEGRRPRATSPRFYELPPSASAPLPQRRTAEGTATSLPTTTGRGSSPGTSARTMPPPVWMPVPETQTNIRMDPDERRTQSTAVDRGWNDEEAE
jgi:serine/threonine-protein kinase